MWSRHLDSSLFARVERSGIKRKCTNNQLLITWPPLNRSSLGRRCPAPPILKICETDGRSGTEDVHIHFICPYIPPPLTKELVRGYSLQPKGDLKSKNSKITIQLQYYYGAGFLECTVYIAKFKGFSSLVRGVRGVKFFLLCVAKLYG